MKGSKQRSLGFTSVLYVKIFQSLSDKYYFNFLLPTQPIFISLKHSTILIESNNWSKCFRESIGLSNYERIQGHKTFELLYNHHKDMHMRQ